MEMNTLFLLPQRVTKKNKRKYAKIWDEFKNQIETINGGKPIKNKKYFLKIRFDSDDDDFPLSRISNITW